MKAKAFSMTDQGKDRKSNQDACGLFVEEQFFVVADGVGGNPGGAHAAQETVDHLFYGMSRLRHSLGNLDVNQIQKLLKLSVSETNQVVINRGKTYQDLKGMASTYCFVFIYDNFAFFSHYGDSRIYFCRNQNMVLITKDHTLAQEREDANEAIQTPSDRRVITRAIGVETQKTPQIDHISIRSKDTFLLCSDGLHEQLSREEIFRHLISPNEPEIILKNLILDARKHGAKDNISAIYIEIN